MTFSARWRVDNFETLPQLERSRRDQFWQPWSARPQLEFIVDNKVVAQLMNLEIQIYNQWHWYESDIVRLRPRMRQSTFKAYTQSSDYKGGHFSWHDWWPPE
eukprot:gnl/MRDRNA2_/MRDRNA2_134313_c0_seq1.p2 gnl/MRDRNA2_/MRDRNA2_134313_c0~~gnl/MRDRNA2_/MRDRNA2_134313_c0_seq1.p2  ORF type:complete len:102 (+),score=14.75 gnl/MRDRNA2_/MRDRNA2_134313_c0_seq1:358-663(+)